MNVKNRYQLLVLLFLLFGCSNGTLATKSQLSDHFSGKIDMTISGLASEGPKKILCTGVIYSFSIKAILNSGDEPIKKTEVSLRYDQNLLEIKPLSSSVDFAQVFFYSLKAKDSFEKTEIKTSIYDVEKDLSVSALNEQIDSKVEFDVSGYHGFEGTEVFASRSSLFSIISNNSQLDETIKTLIPDESFFTDKLLILTNFIYDGTDKAHYYAFSFFEKNNVYMNFVVNSYGDSEHDARQHLYAISILNYYSNASFLTYCSIER